MLISCSFWYYTQLRSKIFHDFPFYLYSPFYLSEIQVTFIFDIDYSHHFHHFFFCKWKHSSVCAAFKSVRLCYNPRKYCKKELHRKGSFLGWQFKTMVKKEWLFHPINFCCKHEFTYVFKALLRHSSWKRQHFVLLLNGTWKWRRINLGFGSI